MLSRRLIRIKAFQVLYAYRVRKENDPQVILNDINNNLNKMQEFYYFLLDFPSHFNTYLESDKELELQKYFPNERNLREASVFSNNFIVNLLDENDEIARKTKKLTYKWTQYGGLFERIFKNLKTQTFFIDYLVFDEPTKAQQAEFLINFYGFVFESEESFIAEMESLYFDLDSDIFTLYKMIKQTLEDTLEQDELKIIPYVISKEDELQFAKNLCSLTATHSSEYDKLIKELTPNWDPERIAMTDIVLLEMAISEFLHFPLIPVKVTINEYLDIAKDFSTPKSHSFINGVLDRMKNKLAEDGKIEKSGRGLRDH